MTLLPQVQHGALCTEQHDAGAAERCDGQLEQRRRSAAGAAPVAPAAAVCRQRHVTPSLQAWRCWHDTARAMRPLYSDFVSLANAGAQANGYDDDGQYATCPLLHQHQTLAAAACVFTLVLQVLAFILRHACTGLRTPG